MASFTVANILKTVTKLPLNVVKAETVTAVNTKNATAKNLLKWYGLFLFSLSEL